MNGPTRVLVVGDLAVDVVAVLTGPVTPDTDSPARIHHTRGGAGANVASWLARLGVPVTLAGRIGADPPGQLVRAELLAAGVACALTVDPEQPTGTVVVLVDPGGERSMIPDRGANRALAPGDLPAALFEDAGHLHLSGYPLLAAGSRSAALAALRRARRSGLSISVDPASVAPLREFGPQRFVELTAGAELLLPNAAEAELLAGTTGAQAAALRLAEHYGAVVVSCGASGAVWARDGQTGAVPAVPTAVLDSTGAGDAFTAGLLAGWLAGRPLVDSVGVAVQTAAQALSQPGAGPTGPGPPAGMTQRSG